MGPLRRLALTLAGLGFAGGCVAPSGPGSSGEVTRAVTDGQVDEAHTAVVALTAGGWPFCSGTLITPTVVLTAAHCLPPHNTSVADVRDIVIVYAANAFEPTETSAVDSGWTHPDFGTAGLNDDIGLVRLTSPGPVKPIPPALDPPEQGADVRVVGYGVTSTNGQDSGIRRSGLAKVDWVGFGDLTLLPEPSNICFGDSGGPSLGMQGTEERVVGIHSHVFGDCGPVGVDERVDIHAEEIRAFVLQTAPTCADDFGCVPDCAVPDPDCACGDDGVCSGACPDGTPDPDCPGLCEADGVCVDTCGGTDPDCPCSEDGRCDASCDDDPDCGAEPCGDDGFCDETCDDDPDCSARGQGSGGCSVAATPQGVPWAGGVFGLLGVAFLLSRSRRH